MNHDQELIRQWAYDWRMSFNPDPQKQAVELIFSTKRIEINHPEIRFNDIPVMKKPGSEGQFPTSVLTLVPAR